MLASVRAYFVCRADHVGDDEWRLVDLILTSTVMPRWPQAPGSRVTLDLLAVPVWEPTTASSPLASAHRGTGVCARRQTPDRGRALLDEDPIPGHEGAIMTLTEERTQVEERTLVEETAPPTSSLPAETTRDWSPTWLLVLVGAVTAVILTFFALRPDSEVDTPSHQQLIEHGSPTAVDQAAEVVVPSHQQLIEHGSPTAVDQAAEVVVPSHQQLIEHGSPIAVDQAAGTGGAVTGSHQQLIEHGSPTAVDQAAGTGGAVTGSYQQLIEHGSPTAVDQAAEVVVPNHPQLIEHGSPTAVDQAAGTDSEVDTPSHQQLIEHGSPIAVDQAASS